MKINKRYNVVIRERKTNKIVATIGKDLSEDRACKRQMTALQYKVDIENFDVDVIEIKEK